MGASGALLGTVRGLTSTSTNGAALANFGLNSSLHAEKASRGMGSDAYEPREHARK